MYQWLVQLKASDNHLGLDWWVTSSALMVGESNGKPTSLCLLVVSWLSKDMVQQILWNRTAIKLQSPCRMMFSIRNFVSTSILFNSFKNNIYFHIIIIIIIIIIYYHHQEGKKVSIHVGQKNNNVKALSKEFGLLRYTN